MTGAELAAQAQAGNWNPYALAYALATGAADPKAAFVRDGGGHRFTAWNTERWQETRARIGEVINQDAKHLAHMETLAACVAAAQKEASRP